jgi:tetratricopeptide (TPR) repeat protein
MIPRSHKFRQLLLIALLVLVPGASSKAEQVASLGEEIQSIKQQTLELNRDLFILEEELLFPSNTQLSVFVSLDVGEFFKLDAVKLSVNGTVVSHYLYTERQLKALQRGGVHRLYLGNIKTGEHEIVAVFTGVGPKGRDYRRGTELKIEKTSGAKNLELKIVETVRSLTLTSTAVFARKFVAALLLMISGPLVAAESVQALRYGVALYHFYQQDYFETLTELMVAQQLDELGVHADTGELLRGGVSLSYGMDREAERIFRNMLANADAPADRDRAWFFLARMAWQRGDTERTALALEQVKALNDSALAEESEYLRATLKLRAGDLAGAENQVAGLAEDSPWLPYHYYNMGALHAASGSWEEAAGYFGQFDDLDIRSEEGKSLRDRAYTASGFAAMAAGDYDRASEDFTRVRLHSPLADRALLGYGWAAGELKDYRSALSPWQELSSRSAISPSVRESLLAIPYAYEQLDRESYALASYASAAQVFESELNSVKSAIEVFREADLLSLLELREEGADEWLFGGDVLPLNPQMPYLKHLIAGHEFQAAMKELRDLHRIQLYLGRARERLAVLSMVDADQQLAWASVIEGDRKLELEQRHKVLLEEIAGLREKVERAAEQGDGRALADAEQQALWQRLERATALVGRLEVREEQADRLDLYRGLMVWEDSENYPDQIWRASRELQDLEQLAESGKQQLLQIEQAIGLRNESGFVTRIEALSSRLLVQRDRVQVALLASQEEIRRVAIAELQSEAEQIARSLGQSKLAMARLYDQGSREMQR